MTGLGFQSYSWRGVPIPDINAWAKDRGEKMVRIKVVERNPYIFSGNIEELEYQISMPESFWDSFSWSGNSHYEEIVREDPK
jgi:hypothetical protein